jgi:hypothetical protein
VPQAPAFCFFTERFESATARDRSTRNRRTLPTIHRQVRRREQIEVQHAKQGGNRFADTVQTRRFGEVGQICRKWLVLLAPRAGFEPATIRLTVECSTAELPRNKANPKGCVEGVANGLRITKAFRLAKREIGASGAVPDPPQVAPDRIGPAASARKSRAAHGFVHESSSIPAANKRQNDLFCRDDS